MSTYTQLTRAQRYQISVLKKAGHTQRDIAEHVGTDESTISRELHRNRCATGYDPAVAHEKAVARRQQKAQRRITAAEGCSAGHFWALDSTRKCIIQFPL
jgi:IS30 family transposase